MAKNDSDKSAQGDPKKSDDVKKDLEPVRPGKDLPQAIRDARMVQANPKKMYYVGLTEDAPSNSVSIPLIPKLGSLTVPRSSGSLSKHPVQTGMYVLTQGTVTGTMVSLTDEEVALAKKFAAERGLWVDAVVKLEDPGEPEGFRMVKVNKENKIVRLDGVDAHEIVGGAVGEIPTRAIPIEDVMWLVPAEEKGRYPGATPPTLGQVHRAETEGKKKAELVAS